MKRYMFNGDLRDINSLNADVLIVGSGAAGLYTALNLDSKIKCIIINKYGTQRSNSIYAQGGVAAVIQPNNWGDKPENHFEDTLTAGAGLCNKEAVRVLVEEAWDNMLRLIDFGVPFDTEDGKLLLTREGGHGRNRILHCGGDATGKHIMKRLNEVAAQAGNIRILDNIFLSDILTDENGVIGVLGLDDDNQPCYFSAPKVVIASGGIGRVFRNSTNGSFATGDGIMAAGRAGAELKDLEFIQFHPTALIHPDNTGRYFLISEALRGEGAILRNRRWEPFMEGVHPLADLAPRDIVSRAIISEMKINDIPHVYLDITSRPREFLKNRFPTIYWECMRRGIDIAKDWIPVMPVQHYLMGGIKTDIDAETNISGLYACGEAACTGVHGANRLASNSLLECLVFGRRCARHINSQSLKPPSQKNQIMNTLSRHENLDFDTYKSEIRTLTTQKCSIIRNERELLEARERIDEIYQQLDALELREKIAIETYNQASMALEIISASLKRKKSIGAHYRSDDN